MNFPEGFVAGLKQRAGDRCECERSECHGTPNRCGQSLVGMPDEQTRWMPVPTGEGVTFPPLISNYIALCLPCVKPRVAPSRASES